MENEQQKRLYWACRRGMLELDLMLIPFLKKEYPHLSPGEQQLFDELLHHTDPELYVWLTHQGVPHDPKLAAIVQRIRTFIQTSPRN